MFLLLLFFLFPNEFLFSTTGIFCLLTISLSPLPNLFNISKFFLLLSIFSSFRHIFCSTKILLHYQIFPPIILFWYHQYFSILLHNFLSFIKFSSSVYSFYLPINFHFIQFFSTGFYNLPIPTVNYLLLLSNFLY